MARTEAPKIKTPTATVYCEQNKRWYTSVQSRQNALKIIKRLTGKKHQKGRKVRCLTGRCAGRWYKSKSILKGADTQSKLSTGTKRVKRNIQKAKRCTRAKRRKVRKMYCNKMSTNPKMKELWRNIMRNATDYIDPDNTLTNAELAEKHTFIVRNCRNGKQVIKRIQCEREVPAELQVGVLVNG